MSDDHLQREASPACTWCESLSEWGACQGHPGLSFSSLNNVTNNRRKHDDIN